MAFFANGTEGSVFGEQCSNCKLWNKPCPIAWVQTQYNYEQVGNDVAEKILESLVKSDGTCKMLDVAREFLEE